MLRAVILLGALAAAAPAAAQLNQNLIYTQEAERRAAEEAARQRDIAITNELSRLQSQAQTNQALSGLAASRVSPVVPPIVVSRTGRAPHINPRQYAQIPDAALADSNAKVRAAAKNRH